MGSATDREERGLLRHALRFPRGRYEASRASQLSGLPERTVYDWAHNRILVPDSPRARPIRWSYRDLVYLRLLARLRSLGMRRDMASARVSLVRRAAAGGDVDEVRLTNRGLFLPGETHDRLSGEAVFEDLVELTERFDLLEPVEGVSTGRLWGPNLIKPSDHTFISPWVLGGEPCIDGSRVPTASVLALVEMRGLSTDDVLVLYPQLTSAGVAEAVSLERRLRGWQAAA